MKIKSSHGGGNWLSVSAAADDGPDAGLADIRRVLSAAVRAQNLIVLTGLGTSLCVTENGARAAPTMAQLLDGLKAAFAEIDKAKNAEAGTRWKTFASLANVAEDTQDLEHLMSRATLAVEFLQKDTAAALKELLTVAESVIRQKVDFLKGSTLLPVHEAFLRRVARRSARRARTKIFTTNYDLCFERAARLTGFVVVDGFAFGSDDVFDPAQFTYDVVRRSVGEEKSDFIENLFHLYKLHGSIDWELNEKSGHVSRRPGSVSPLLIYPRSNKYEMAFSQPYIEMMGALQGGLRASNTTLLVIGFGFNDKHIAEPILAAIRANLSLNVIVVNPDIEEASGADGNAYLAAISSLIDGGDARLALIAAKFEEVVPVVPDVIAETELERHAERVRAIGNLNG
ncbi:MULTISPECIES: SIR2 family protein [unclassified Rhizobium]|uniref:SIR2 family protein n=1 Tax=unclassified Rhizobium TaxID=2613769 RepID=UPI001AD96289|nr:MULTISPECIES: SIR2 family protein [unclassified Rhizobium]MBO9124928.1 SIR2 family protein [Rhizobium sp. 16-488-2b]MBO9175513.1 SIR2 family protein [Rhizobium sp. 16-488-2a]